MALIPKQGTGGQAATLTTNINFLSPLGFRFLLKRAPNLEYFCQAVTLPAISTSEVIQPNPLANVYRPGDRITYEPFSLRFRVDEDMKNYLEIHDWMVGIGHPENLQQYRDLAEKVSDGSMMILSSNSNPSIMISLYDMFPTSLTPLNFDVTQTDIEYLEAEVTFRYRQFIVEKL